MPSPFPGMDPYLEGELWTSFHALFVPEIVRLLTPQLRPRYIALPQKYHIVVDAAESPEALAQEMYPDVGVAQAAASPGNLPGTTALLTPPLEMETITVVGTRVPHLWIEIRDLKRRTLVTAIEFLSPANKQGPGRKKNLRKRRRLLHSSCHLLEIDLLRQGQRVPMARPLPSLPYFVFVSRAQRRPITGIWPIALEQSLPPVPVPLLAGDPDVTLDLQTAFARAYDVCGFDSAIDYRDPPDIPLHADQAAWVEDRLRDAGLRP
jgi:hypothetical protein